MSNTEKKDNNKMTFSQFIILLIYIFFTVSGLTLIKLGGIQNFSIASGNISLNINIKAIIGILCYLISFIIYIVLISNFQLNYIIPITTGIVYILILLVSILFLNEKLNVYQCIGAGIILIGVILMNLKNT